VLRVLGFLISLGLCHSAVADPAATDALNAFRDSKGRSAVAYSQVLERAAQAHAQDMAWHGYFDHTGRDGSTIGDRLRAQGYGYCFAAENIAKGQTSLDEVMKGWAHSPGHRKNMAHKKVTEFALARADGNLWVLVLGTPDC
jgi:uncharacterized protein YkwD